MCVVMRTTLCLVCAGSCVRASGNRCHADARGTLTTLRRRAAAAVTEEAVQEPPAVRNGSPKRPM
ncbi:hypothetical protein PBS_64810 [Paraburkholderia sp. 2C]